MYRYNLHAVCQLTHGENVSMYACIYVCMHVCECIGIIYMLCASSLTVNDENVHEATHMCVIIHTHTYIYMHSVLTICMYLCAYMHVTAWSRASRQ